MTARRTETGFRPRDTETLDVYGLPSPPPWTVDAACAEIGPDLFFPEGQGSSARAAKRICAGCPVSVECLNYALDAEAAGGFGGGRHGIFGGLAPRERAQLRPNRPGRRGAAA